MIMYLVYRYNGKIVGDSLRLFLFLFLLTNVFIGS